MISDAHLPEFDPDGRPELSVVVPAYNERGHICDTIDSLEAAVADACDGYEIIVVDDGSANGTVDRVRTLSEERPLVGFLAGDENRGKGHAIRRGCQVATGEVVLLLDADGELTPDRITTFLGVMRETGADVVIGSKRHPDSTVTYPPKRRVLSAGYSLLIRLLFGLQVSDTQVGMKLLRWEVVEDVMPLLLVERYAFDVELLALAHWHGYTITEAPVSLDFDGHSSINWREVVRIGADTVRVFLRLNLLRSYDALERAVEYKNDKRSVTGGRDD